MRKEKTNSPRIVAKKFLKKAFISNPFLLEIVEELSDKTIASVFASVGINNMICQWEKVYKKYVVMAFSSQAIKEKLKEQIAKHRIVR